LLRLIFTQFIDNHVDEFSDQIRIIQIVISTGLCEEICRELQGFSAMRLFHEFDLSLCLNPLTCAAVVSG
jgi:hypothetical protein